MKKSIFTALLLVGINASAEVVVPVFGLPLGGNISTNMKTCPSNTDKAKNVCWIGKPFVSKDGEKLGSVHLPNPDSRPDWTAHAMFEMQTGRNGELQQLKVTTFEGKAKHVIANSITSRFGLPTESTLPREATSSASWARPDIFINLLCGEQCYVSFVSAKAHSEREQRLAENRRKQASRPKSP